MTRIYLIRDQYDNEVPTYKKTWCYKTLGAAKGAAKNIINNKNKTRDRNNKLHFEHLKVIECEMVQKETHPI
jgi:hypothetical protein